ncbi:MAG: hypothetical protein IH594_13100 [Bacteroidales bacterium]|nr:hypothetical protein [Bacteroidales bacterium]
MGGHEHASQLPGCLVAAQFLSGNRGGPCHFDRREKPPEHKRNMGIIIYHFIPLYPGDVITNDTENTISL